MLWLRTFMCHCIVIKMCICVHFQVIRTHILQSNPRGTNPSPQTSTPDEMTNPQENPLKRFYLIPNQNDSETRTWAQHRHVSNANTETGIKVEEELFLFYQYGNLFRDCDMLEGNLGHVEGHDINYVMPNLAILTPPPSPM